MTVSPLWITVGAISAAVFLLLLLRVGADIEYGEQLVLRLRAGPVRYTLIPGKKRPSEKKRKARPAEKEKPAADIFRQVKTYFPLALETAGRFRKKLRIDLLVLECTVRGSDPAEAGILFGAVSALLGMSIPALENTFDLRSRRLIARLDFTPGKPSVYAHAVFSLAVWQGLSLGLGFFFGYLKLRRQKKQRKSPVGSRAVSSASS